MMEMKIHDESCWQSIRETTLCQWPRVRLAIRPETNRQNRAPAWIVSMGGRMKILHAELIHSCYPIPPPHTWRPREQGCPALTDPLVVRKWRSHSQQLLFLEQPEELNIVQKLYCMCFDFPGCLQRSMARHCLCRSKWTPPQTPTPWGCHHHRCNER